MTIYSESSKIDTLKMSQNVLSVIDESTREFLLSESGQVFECEYFETTPAESTHSLQFKAQNHEKAPLIAVVWTDEEDTLTSAVLTEVVVNLSAVTKNNSGIGSPTPIYGKVFLIITNPSGKADLAIGATITSLTDETATSLKYYYDNATFKGSQSSCFFVSGVKYSCLLIFVKE